MGAVGFGRRRHRAGRCETGARPRSAPRRGHDNSWRAEMKVAPYDENAFHMDHPRGTVAFNYLLMGGEPEKLENYRYILGRQEGDFRMPRHRHTFEQIR